MVKWLLDKSIVRKFIFYILSFFVVAGTAFIIIYGIQGYDSAIRQINKKVINIAELASTALATPLWNIDEPSIKGVINAIKLDEDIIAIHVLGSGDLVSSYQDERFKETFDQLKLKKGMLYQEIGICKKGRCGVTLEEDSDEGESNEQIGQVQMIASTERVDREITQSILMLLASVSFVGGMLSLIIWALARKIIQHPIKELIVSANALAEGHLNHEINVSRPDELGSLARDFAEMRDSIREKIKVIEEYSRDLEKKVDERTSQLRAKTNDILSILKNIPEGVLTVLEGNTVHHEYSAYLETILGTSDISGQDVVSLLFSQLGSDSRSGLGAALDSILGQNVMFFEANSHFLVREIEFLSKDGQTKVLDLSWAPITDDMDDVEKVLITLRDVTELRQLQETAKEHKRELEIIGQILHVSQEKFNEFIHSSRNFLEENKKLIEANYTQKNPEILSELFRNMHTIKGNARTYTFIHLTNLVHEAEEKYNRLRNLEEEAWNPDILLEDLNKVGLIIDEYDQINTGKLGRKGPGRRGDERFLMVEKVKVRSALDYLTGIEKLTAQQLKDHIIVARAFLTSIGSEPLEDILSGVLTSIADLARELEKPAPEIVIADHNLYIKNQIYGLIRNAFGHIFRNSLDHGIERSEERLQRGKSAQGHIFIEMTHDKSMLKIVYMDDGRGLNIGKIRQKAIKSQMIHDMDDLSDHEVAQMIFMSGLSTTEQVTEISGRGVGMDAVKKFFERENGNVEVELLSPEKYHDPGFYPFKIILSLPFQYAIEMPTLNMETMLEMAEALASERNTEN
ncbi:MAG: HAMP domain-containing protein [SAR324 cluster bacterium]|nr:HAMP domain-containing protein [SAR324 cluster bacterium]